MKRGLGQRTSEEVEALADEAEAAGICVDSSGDKRLAKLMARRTRKGIYVQPYPSAFVRKKTWKHMTYVERARMVVLTVARRHPEWTFCLESAAVVHGLEVSGVDPSIVHVLADDHAHVRDTPHVVHHDAGGLSTCTCGGTHVTTLEQTAASYLAERDYPHGLAVADSVLKITGCGLDALHAYIDDGVSDAGKRQFAHATASWADPKSDNGGESYARGVMILLGFERPELQVPFGKLTENEDYFADYLWRTPEGDIVAELDGRDKYVDEEMTGGRDIIEVMRDERIRESRITFRCKGIIRFKFRTVQNTEKFRALLLKYGVPLRGGAG